MFAEFVLGKEPSAGFDAREHDINPVIEVASFVISLQFPYKYCSQLQYEYLLCSYLSHRGFPQVLQSVV